jgi:hypothetical protein
MPKPTPGGIPPNSADVRKILKDARTVLMKLRGRKLREQYDTGFHPDPLWPFGSPLPAGEPTSGSRDRPPARSLRSRPNPTGPHHATTMRP